MEQIKVERGKTVIIAVSLGFDVSGDTFESDIRVSKNELSTLIASCDVSFDNNGKDGELVITLDSSITINITQSVGYIDLKRVSGIVPLPVFDESLEVSIIDFVAV